MSLFKKTKRLLKQIAGHDLWTRRQLKCENKHYGDWCICPVGISENSVVYSFGVGEDVTFDQSLINDFGLHVYAFDPTPNSVEWVNSSKLPDKFHFYGYGISKNDGAIKMFPRVRKGRRSREMFTLVEDGSATSEAIKVDVYRLQTILGMLGHTKIDILKMDVEAAEYDVIDDLIASEIEIYQLLVEFHHRFKSVGKSKTKNAIEKLNRHGYKVFNISELGREYSFIKISDYDKKRFSGPSFEKR
jgi:FkbM family methyltransferase